MTTAVSRLPQVRQEINSLLADYYTRHAAKAALLHPDYASLWRTLHQFGADGGKRLRPYIMIVAYEGLGGTQQQAALHVAAALELLHTSLLIHDDIIDRDYRRYGRLNVAGHYRNHYAKTGISAAESEHFAAAAALLGGDLALSGAYSLIMDSPFTSEQKVAAAHILSEALYTVAGGELLDTESVLHDFNDVDTLAIADLKTASYSFIYPLRMAAKLAVAPASTEEQLVKMGSALGTAYQLADDILGLFGDEATTGKPATGDIKEGKRTYLMQRTLANCREPELTMLSSILGKGEVDANQAELVRHIVRESGALADTEQLMHKLAGTAADILAELPLTSAAKAELQQLIAKAVKRQS